MQRWALTDCVPVPLSSRSLMWFVAHLQFPGMQRGLFPLKCFDCGVISFSPLKGKTFIKHGYLINWNSAVLAPPPRPCTRLGCNLDQLSSATASSLKIEIRLWWFFLFLLGLKWIFSLCLPPRCAAATGLQRFKPMTVNKNFFSLSIHTISRVWLSGLLKIRGGVCVFVCVCVVRCWVFSSNNTRLVVSVWAFYTVWFWSVRLGATPPTPIPGPPSPN